MAMMKRPHFPISPYKDVDWVKQVCHVSTKFPVIRATLRRAENMSAEHQTMRKSGRYPYDYAYDFIREAGVIPNVGTPFALRAAAAEWVKNIIDSGKIPNTTAEQFCTMLAEQYITYAVKVAEADETKKGDLSFIRSLEKAHKVIPANVDPYLYAIDPDMEVKRVNELETHDYRE